MLPDRAFPSTIDARDDRISPAVEDAMIETPTAFGQSEVRGAPGTRDEYVDHMKAVGFVNVEGEEPSLITRSAHGTSLRSLATVRAVLRGPDADAQLFVRRPSA